MRHTETKSAQVDPEPSSRPALDDTRIAPLALRDKQIHGPRTKPEDLDADESQRWDQQCSELDQALKRGDTTRSRHALAMLERLRYGCK